MDFSNAGISIIRISLVNRVKSDLVDVALLGSSHQQGLDIDQLLDARRDGRPVQAPILSDPVCRYARFCFATPGGPHEDGTEDQFGRGRQVFPFGDKRRDRNEKLFTTH